MINAVVVRVIGRIYVYAYDFDILSGQSSFHESPQALDLLPELVVLSVPAAICQLRHSHHQMCSHMTNLQPEARDGGTKAIEPTVHLFAHCLRPVPKWLLMSILLPLYCRTRYSCYAIAGQVSSHTDMSRNYTTVTSRRPVSAPPGARLDQSYHD